MNRRSCSRWSFALVVTLTGLGYAGYAQVVNPADKQRPETKPEAVSEAVHVGSWELPAITVTGEQPAVLREEDKVGTYGQPRWTAHRRFPRTRIYVVPEGKFEFEFWTRADVPKDDGPTEIQTMYEVEMGLPHRFQLDLYLVARTTGDTETYLDQKFEVRYAFADWGKIPGNPTLYVEYALIDRGDDKVEIKLLLGDELAPRWHWGVNAVCESVLTGERDREYAVTAGLSYTVVDEKLSIGIEAEGAIADTKEDRGSFSKALLVGPSLQYKPLPNMHIDIAPLIGVTDDSPAAKAFLNIGWEF
ncbi:MAG: transporter [bacterium]